MCEGTIKLVNVKIPYDLSCDGKEHWKEMAIDSCIAPIVEALQAGGIDMRGSCCGHGRVAGTIHLQDGRTLIVTHDEIYIPNVVIQEDIRRDFSIDIQEEATDDSE